MMEIIDIGYEKIFPAIGKQPAGKIIMNKSLDTNCDEYRLFLPEFKDWALRHEWTFAKTQPEFPHEYVAKPKLKTQADIDEFHNVVKFIQKYGYDKYFFKYLIRYLDVDKYKYWTMGWYWKDTTIINRAVRDS